MKYSGVKCLGDIPEHWKVKKLKYIAIIKMGQSPSSNEYNYKGEGDPFIQGSAEFGKLNLYQKFIVKQRINTLSLVIFYFLYGRL